MFVSLVRPRAPAVHTDHGGKSTDRPTRRELSQGRAYGTLVIDEIVRRHPAGQPELVAFLAWDRAASITGSKYVIDGGTSHDLTPNVQ